MRDAGINLVRIGEFAWSRVEPEEGRYALDWLHRCVEVMAAHGIEAMMCTPTAAPPAWLTSAQYAGKFRRSLSLSGSPLPRVAPPRAAPITCRLL
jgi:beta-galactosidase GanA